MKKTQTVREFAYLLAGFPVVVENVEVIVTGEGEFPLLDYEELDRRILVALATKPTKLTGNQVRFIRHSFELPLREFAQLFRFKGSSACNWEKRANESTSMEWPTELLLRTRVLMRFADEETAMRNLRNLSDQTLVAAPADEKIRITPCPPARSAETSMHVSFEFVWPERRQHRVVSKATAGTEIKGNVSYGGVTHGRVTADAKKENPAHDFADAA